MPKKRVNKNSRKKKIELCNSNYYSYIGSKGISPLIATVLVIGFVIVMAAMLFMWGGGFVKKIKDEQKIKSNVNLKCNIGLTKTDVTAEKVNDGIVVSINNKDKEKVAGVNIRLYDSAGKVVYKAFSVVETKEYGAKKYGVKTTQNVASVGVFPLVEGDKSGNNKKLYPCSDKEIKANVVPGSGAVGAAATIAVEGTTGNIDVVGEMPDKCGLTPCNLANGCGACPIGFKCVTNTCVVDKCTSDADCKPGGCQLRCRDEVCVKGVSGVDSCTLDCDCEYFCSNSKCSNVKTCATNTECSSIPPLNTFSWVCRGSNCVAGGQSDGKINDVCLVNADCSSGLLCKSGKCSSCASHAECGTGKICRIGNCVAGGLSDGDSGADCSAGADCKSGNCYSGKCCAPLTSCPSGTECGSISNNCGGTLSCGTCASGKLCVGGKCTVCTPSCSGKTCGSDGCGGSCGTCPIGKTCDGSGQCVCQYVCSSGSKQCGGNYPYNDVQECKLGTSGCYEWQNIKTCVSPQICSGGQCVCQNECSSEGQERCPSTPDTITIDVCAKDDYGCLYWNNIDCKNKLIQFIGTCDSTSYPLYEPNHCDDTFEDDDLPSSPGLKLGEDTMLWGSTGYIYNNERDYIEVKTTTGCVRVVVRPYNSPNLNLDIYAETKNNADFSPAQWYSSSGGAGQPETLNLNAGVNYYIVLVQPVSSSGWYYAEMAVVSPCYV